MGEITLHPDHLTVHREPGHSATIRPESVQDLLPYALYSLDIDPDVTLADLFRLVDRYDVGLLEVLLDLRISPLLEEARRGPVASDGRVVLHSLRVSHRHEFGYLRLELDAPGAPEHGRGEDAGGAGGHEERYSVSLEPVGYLLHLPIRHDPEVLCRNRSWEVEYRTTLHITLIQFLKAVFDDLTFHGTPAQRDERRRELRELVARIDRGEEKLIPHDEVMRRLRAMVDGDDEGDDDGDDQGDDDGHDESGPES